VPIQAKSSERLDFPTSGQLLLQRATGSLVCLHLLSPSLNALTHSQEHKRWLFSDVVISLPKGKVNGMGFFWREREQKSDTLPFDDFLRRPLSINPPLCFRRIKRLLNHSVHPFRLVCIKRLIRQKVKTKVVTVHRMRSENFRADCHLPLPRRMVKNENLSRCWRSVKQSFRFPM